MGYTRTTLYAFVAVLLLAGQFLRGTDIFVLCVGEDGHVEVEVALGARCAESLDEALHGSHDTEGNTEFDAPHCGTCEDSPLGWDSALAAKKRLQDVAPFGAALAASSPGIAPMAATASPAPATSAATPPPAFLRTTRLVV